MAVHRNVGENRSMANTHRPWMSALLLLLAGWLPGASPADQQGLQVQQVSERIYALVGPYGNRSADNLGNNATFGVIVTDQGVILIDSGGSYQGAAAIQAAIAGITDQAVRIVINTGGQDHRWLGNGYFKEKGARIISSRRAVEDQRARSQDQLIALNSLIGAERLAGTNPVYADEVFDDRLDLALGDVALELHHIGQAHTPGDLLVWIPQAAVAATGDIVYVGRMLGVMPHSNSRSWIEVFNAMAAFAPAAIIPGHGPVATLDQARKDTLDYLVALRERVGAFMQDGGGIEDIGSLDQSDFAYLVSYDELKGRNAQQVFQEMEWE